MDAGLDSCSLWDHGSRFCQIPPGRRLSLTDESEMKATTVQARFCNAFFRAVLDIVAKTLLLDPFRGAKRGGHIALLMHVLLHVFRSCTSLRPSPTWSSSSCWSEGSHFLEPMTASCTTSNLIGPNWRRLRYGVPGFYTFNITLSLSPTLLLRTQ